MTPDPFKNFRFLVEIDKIVQAGFSDCTGLGSSVEVIQYREGGDPSHVRKLPGKTSYPDIVLKWGVTFSRELYDWHRSVIQGNPKHLIHRNGSILLIGDEGIERVRWNFYGAWPSAWKGPDFSGLGKDVAIESLTLACERIERA